MSNDAAISAGVNGFARNVNLFHLMVRIADDFMTYISSSDVIPVETGNLKDSTGVGLYLGDVLLKYVPNPIAKIPRSNLGINGYDKGDVWGKDMIQVALNAGRERYNLGYHLVLFSAMPYAKFVDNDRSYFESELKSHLNNIINGITANHVNVIHIEDTR